MQIFSLRLLLLFQVYANCLTFARATTLNDWLEQNNNLIFTDESANKWGPLERHVSLEDQFAATKALASQWNVTLLQTDSMNLIRLVWWKLDVRFSQSFAAQAKTVKYLVRQLIWESRLISEQCDRDLIGWLDGLGKLDFWAYQMWLAWGNLPRPGFFPSAYQDEGSPWACKKVNESAIGLSKQLGQAKYCKLQLAPLVASETLQLSLQGEPILTTNPVEYETNNLNLKTQLFREMSRKSLQLDFERMSIGSCWPQSCSIGDIESLVGAAAARFGLKLDPVQCEDQQTQIHSQITASQQSLVLIGIFFLSCLIISTLLDYTIVNESQSKLDKYFVNIFSLRRNLKSLIDVRAHSDINVTSPSGPIRGLSKQQLPQVNNEHLSCLDGFRLVTLLWIIYCQTLFSHGTQNFMLIYQKLGKFAEFVMISPLMQPDLAIDTFYLIAGLVSCYTLMSMTRRYGFNYRLAIHVIAKNLMLTPINVITIVCFTLLPRLLDQPFYWQFDANRSDDHSSLFEYIYLQPFVNMNEINVQPLIWFLVEATFLIIVLSLIRIICLEQHQQELGDNDLLGPTINKSLIVASLLLNSYYQYSSSAVKRQWPALVQNYVLNQQIGVIHRPHLHATAFFMGIAIGKKLYEDLRAKQNQCNTIPSNRIKLGWIECSIGFVMAIWGFHHISTFFLHEYYIVTIALYGFLKVTFALAIGWMIHVCALGQGGEFNHVMSHENAKFFAKLIHIMFVTQMLVIYLHAGGFVRDFESFMLNLLILCVSNSWLCLELAVLLWVLVEGPMEKVQSLLLGKHEQRLKVFQHELGLGATIFHLPKTEILSYKTSLKLNSVDEEDDDDDYRVAQEDLATNYRLRD